MARYKSFNNTNRKIIKIWNNVFEDKTEIENLNVIKTDSVSYHYNKKLIRLELGRNLDVNVDNQEEGMGG